MFLCLAVRPWISSVLYQISMETEISTFWNYFLKVFSKRASSLVRGVCLSDSDLQSPSREQILKPEGFLKSQGTSSRRTVNTWEPKGVTGIQ